MYCYNAAMLLAVGIVDWAIIAFIAFLLFGRELFRIAYLLKHWRRKRP